MQDPSSAQEAETNEQEQQLTLEKLRLIFIEIQENRKQLEYSTTPINYLIILRRKLKFDRIDHLEKNLHTELQLQSHKLLNEEMDKQFKRAADDFGSKLASMSQKTERELKRMAEIVAEKDYIIQATKKQSNVLQSRVHFIESENLSLKNSLMNLETLISQELEIAKNTIKELQEELKEQQLDRGLVESKYIGLTQKCQKLLAKIDLTTMQLHKSQEEAADLRAQLRQAQRKIEQFTAKEKRNNYTKSKMQFSQNEVPNISNIDITVGDPTTRLLTEHESMLKNIMDSLNSSTRELEECCVIREKYDEQVEHNKDLCKQLDVMEEVQLSYIKKYDEPRYTQIFEDRHPEAIKYFQQKVPEFQAFESKLESISNMMEKAEEAICNTLRGVKISVESQDSKNNVKDMPGYDLMLTTMRSLVDILHAEIMKLDDQAYKQKKPRKGSRGQGDRIVRCCYCWGRVKGSESGLTSCNKCHTNKIHEGCMKYQSFSDCPYYNYKE